MNGVMGHDRVSLKCNVPSRMVPLGPDVKFFCMPDEWNDPIEGAASGGGGRASQISKRVKVAQSLGRLRVFRSAVADTAFASQTREVQVGGRKKTVWRQ